MTNKEYENIMLDFLNAYLAMAAGETAGKPNNQHKLHARAGLCYNIIMYIASRFGGGEDGDAVEQVLKSMLNHQIQHQMPWNINSLYPFNDGDYTRRVMDNTQHECPARLAFVKRYIEYLEA